MEWLNGLKQWFRQVESIVTRGLEASAEPEGGLRGAQQSMRGEPSLPPLPEGAAFDALMAREDRYMADYHAALDPMYTLGSKAHHHQPITRADVAPLLQTAGRLERLQEERESLTAAWGRPDRAHSLEHLDRQKDMLEKLKQDPRIAELYQEALKDAAKGAMQGHNLQIAATGHAQPGTAHAKQAENGLRLG